jgi:hypothetical protein
MWANWDGAARDSRRGRVSHEPEMGCRDRTAQPYEASSLTPAVAS